MELKDTFYSLEIFHCGSIVDPLPKDHHYCLGLSDLIKYEKILLDYDIDEYSCSNPSKEFNLLASIIWVKVTSTFK